MRERAVAALRVTVAVTGRDTAEITWSPAGDVRVKFEYARIFLVPLGTDATRRYLELVDGRRAAAVLRLPALPDGDYAIEVDAYGSASWGDGRLDGRGRSAAFTLGDRG
ncbi:hypothetical protein [Nocardia otitidiscaviarum]|uniref:hypothetical protein n=1 Tax=Nocardia otitidiscaviarum TaxID=1823 RepID=UPI0018956121|nr:hypothetical protein [Nocardia otitidiscaviarum]MBF6177604.1 hypothetical protein [Nocardia otitidiscaviarum]